MLRTTLATVALAWLLTLAPTGSAQAAPMFPDVPPTHWAYDAVKVLAEKGIIEGYPGGAPAKPAPAPAPTKKKPRPKK